MALRTGLSQYLALGGVILFGCLLPAHAQNDLEEKVKTAFVFNFAKFVDWPKQNATDRGFNICVAGQTSMGSTISRSLEGKNIRDRDIRVSQIGWSPDELAGCHMLYLNGSDSSDARRLLEAANSKPILTIGEGDDFSRNGGIIRFLLVDGKVRFTINQSIASRVGLNISAKLLEVALEVRREQSSTTHRPTRRRNVLVS